MIGQHIYSRCLEGYFSGGLKRADSTTVTMDMGLFGREEMARKAATECERIGGLEDARPVPVNVQGAYRGILKIRRMGKQISVVCRSYRLSARDNRTRAFTGDDRDFTFSTSYLLTGEEKDKFFENPEYCLNLGDFESFPSVVQRVEAARAQGRGGKIEPNRSMSLFNSEAKEIDSEIFRLAGFTEKLFVEYISSILERTAFLGQEGRDKDKVLLVLPDQFNPDWTQTGGNMYAEQLLAATLRVLPSFARSMVSAVTGGGSNPGAYILDKYQLVFMEGGDSRDWRSREHSIIDLQKQESYVSGGLDTSYAQFIWDNLKNPQIRKEFEEKYIDLFGRENVENGGNTPAKLGFLLRLLDAEKDTVDQAERNKYLCDIINFSGNNWTNTGTNLAQGMLRGEIADPVHNPGTSGTLLALIKRESCPAELREQIVKLLVDDIFCGAASAEIQDWALAQMKSGNAVVGNYIVACAKNFCNDIELVDMEKHSLPQFLMRVVRDEQLMQHPELKDNTLDIFFNWFIEYYKKNGQAECVLIVNNVSVHLTNPSVNEARKNEICRELMLLLFNGNADTVHAVGNLLSSHVLAKIHGTQSEKILWDNFAGQISDCERINESVTGLFAYYAVHIHEQFLNTEWKNVYETMCGRFITTQQKEVVGDLLAELKKWTEGQDTGRKKLAVNATEIVLDIALTGTDMGVYLPAPEQLREDMKLLKEYGRNGSCTKFWFIRYENEPQSGRRDLLQRYEAAERDDLALTAYLEDRMDPALNQIAGEMCRNRSSILHSVSRLQITEETKAEKLSRLYFAEVEKSVQRDHYPLKSWCREFKNDRGVLRQSLNGSAFTKHYLESLKQKIAGIGPVALMELDKTDVQVLREIGISSDMPKWYCLKVLNDINNLDPKCTSQECHNLFNDITSEGDDSIARAYNVAIKDRIKELCRMHVQYANENDGLYNLAFCDGFMNNDNNMVMNISRSFFKGEECEQKYLLVAFKLLGVVGEYIAGEGSQRLGSIYQMLLRQIIGYADRDRKSLCDDEVAKAYRELNGEDKRQLRGLNTRLQTLSSEWQSKYGIIRQNSGGSIVAGIITGSVLAVLSIAFAVCGILFMNKIGVSIAMYAGMGVMAAGLLLALVSIVMMLLSREEQPVDNRSRRSNHNYY